MKIIQQIKNRIAHKTASSKNETILQKVISDPDHLISQLGKSIEFVINSHELTDEEKNAFSLIEALRNELKNSDEVIIVKDFGAGKPNAQRSKFEMESGMDSKKVVKDILTTASSTVKVGQLIFRIILNVQPKRCLELGTSLGISGAYQLAALKINNSGELITIEGAEEVSKIAEKNFHKMGFDNFTIHNGRFKDVLPKILSNDNLFDLVFIDGHHDQIATKEYFEQIYPFLEERAILIFDDIYWSEGMTKVWEEIYNDNRVNYSIDIGRWGICYVNKKISNSQVNYRKLIF